MLVAGLWSLAIAVGAVALVAWRLRVAHPAPLYPDGYQYLAMARGIAEGGRPLLQLGVGGELLAPNADAAVKPVFPALIALLHTVGVPLGDAAAWIAALASAAVGPLAGLVALRLTGGSLPAALATAAVVVASPTVGFWHGFAGPDGLAIALALASALTALSRRPVLCGTLAALACATRPELALVAGAALCAGLLIERGRGAALRAASAGVLTLGAMLVALRPALPSVSISPVAAGLAATILAGVLAAVALRSRRPATQALALVVPLVLVAVSTVRAGGSEGWVTLLAREWPLLLCAALGSVVALTRQERRLAVVLGGSVAAWLALAYLLKNPGSERYSALVVPILALGVGLGVAMGSRRVQAALAAAVLVVAGVTAATRGAPAVGSDMFPEVAVALERLPAGLIVTAAPDAYGVLAPGRPMRQMRLGERGLIVVDATARAYEPHLRARGRLVATIPTAIGFLRPDGLLDRDPVRVIEGEVVTR